LMPPGATGFRSPPGGSRQRSISRQSPLLPLLPEHPVLQPASRSPHQLPADLPDFTGRERQVQDLVKLLKAPGKNVAMLALGGMGGVGKTSLAVHVAHLASPAYLDGQLFVELRGTSAEPLQVAEAMRQVIHAFDPTAKVADHQDDRIQQYRSVLHGKRVLLLLDNAVNDEQVAPMIIGPPCGSLASAAAYR